MYKSESRALALHTDIKQLKKRLKLHGGKVIEEPNFQENPIKINHRRQL
jgi:hypothetical protein